MKSSSGSLAPVKDTGRFVGHSTEQSSLQRPKPQLGHILLLGLY
jgi:hypothetical protein